MRAQHDRVLGKDADGHAETLRQRLAKAPVLAETRFKQPGGNGRAARTVHQQIKAVRLRLPAPRRPDRTLANVEITAILATEPEPPPGEDPVEWLPLTNLPATAPEQALEKLQWYLCRWQIEIFSESSKAAAASKNSNCRRSNDCSRRSPSTALSLGGY